LGLIVVTGEPGSRADEVSRLAAQLLPEIELLTAGRLDPLLAAEAGEIPDRAWGDLVTVIVARAALEHHLIVCVPGAEFLFERWPGVLRVRIQANEARRVGNVLVERRLERPQAVLILKELEREARLARRRRFGKAKAPDSLFDLTLNAERLPGEQMAGIIADVSRTKGVFAAGLLPAAAEAQIQFQARLRLAGHGIVPPGKASVKRRVFANRSEQVFANLLDFYRIRWEYEPKSFALTWDEKGQALEHFTPDFFLPEAGIYVELTTMKQSLVTKKNRKVKLLKQLYPEVNIQIFYQRDFQNLIFKYGLLEAAIMESPAEV
jgi:hypothetical protein